MSDPYHVLETEVPFAPFHTANVRAVDATHVGELLLRHPHGMPIFLHGLTEGHLWVFFSTLHASQTTALTSNRRRTYSIQTLSRHRLGSHSAPRTRKEIVMKVFSSCRNCQNASSKDTIYQCKSCKARYCSECRPTNRCEKCGKEPSFFSLASQFREIGKIK